jgi:hypothetical protein
MPFSFGLTAVLLGADCLAWGLTAAAVARFLAT